MKFRLINSLNDFNLNVGLQPVIFQNRKKPTIELEVKHITVAQNQMLCCVATIEKQPNKKLQRMFLSFSQNKIPSGCKVDKDWPQDIVDREGNIKANYNLPMRWLPKSFISYSHNISQLLHQESVHLLHLLRWRCGVRGKHNFISSLRFEFSLDGDNWFVFPSAMQVYVESKNSELITEEIKSYIVNSEERSEFEPVAHDLWHESWGQRHENPRSSLVLGISAAETAIKHFICRQIPDAEWLMLNLQSPSMEKIFLQFLPSIISKTKGQELEMLIPEGLVDFFEPIKKGINRRNMLVHRGEKNFDYDDLEIILVRIRDLLWLLDYYNGSVWALDYFKKLENSVGRAI
jgi:hypothetical protein